eukprot:s741_g10.t1
MVVRRGEKRFQRGVCLCPLLHLVLAAPAQQSWDRWDRSPAVRMQRCFASGKLLDLTNGTVGVPDCVDQCAPPGERTIQAEGVGFCMLPVARKDAFDVSFAVQLRNISLRKLPPTDWIRMSLPVAVGQALQVAPSDVPLELMIRDASMYDSHVLRSFKLRRKDEVEPEPAGLEAFELQQKQRVQEAEVTDQVPEEGEMPKASNISGSKKRVSVAYGPCRSGSCNLYVAVRCEVWRLPNKDGDMLPDSPLLQALQDRAAGEVGRLLGLVGNWSLVDVSLTERRARGITNVTGSFASGLLSVPSLY